MSYVKIPKENHEKALAELARAIELSEKIKERIDRALRENQRRRAQIDANLRRAGLLRD